MLASLRLADAPLVTHHPGMVGLVAFRVYLTPEPGRGGLQHSAEGQTGQTGCGTNLTLSELSKIRVPAGICLTMGRCTWAAHALSIPRTSQTLGPADQPGMTLI